jgi:ribonucleoside-diphosphate reductase subunit M2
LIDDRKRSVSPDSQDAEDDLEELRKKFVGEIDLPESQ